MGGVNASRLIREALRIDPVAVKRKLETFIEKKVRESGTDGVVIGLSGGLDSSVAAVLSKEALGRRRVLGICMPEAGVTPQEDVADARGVAGKLGIGFKVIDITPAVQEIQRALPDFQPEARIPAANIKPRVRMTILYYYANLLNRLVVGGGNRSELRAGYLTKFGDGAADLFPNGCLYKTQVKQLAEHLGLPRRIIEKVPSAGLWPGQTDEGELGIPYEKLDMIYVGIDLKLKPEVIAKAAGVSVDKVKYFIERERRMAHKLIAPSVPEL